MNEMKIRLRIDEPMDIEEIESSAKKHQVKVEFSAGCSSGDIERQSALVAGALVIAGIGTIAKFVSDWWEKRKGGLVVELRADSEYEIYRKQEVPYGVILVVTLDGTRLQVKVETHDMAKDTLQYLLESVINGVFKNAGEAAKSIRNKLSELSVESEVSMLEAAG